MLEKTIGSIRRSLAGAKLRSNQITIAKHDIIHRQMKRGHGVILRIDPGTEITQTIPEMASHGL